MKKVISWLVAFILLFVVTPFSLAESDWISSDDSVLEAKFIGFEETSYPQYTTTIQFRLDGKKESNVFTSTFNLNSTISQYTTAHPEKKNRKVTVSCEGIISSFTCSTGTVYEILLPITIGEEEKIDARITIDAATVFPNDFVNADAMTAALILDSVRLITTDPTSFSVNSAEVLREGSDIYYAFSINAKNRMGGITSEVLLAGYEETSGNYAVWAIQAGEIYIEKGKTMYDKVTSKAINFIINNYSLGGTALSVDTILKYMN